MKVLVVGGGGREHALSWKAVQSPSVEAVYVAPGNAGTALESGIQNVNIKPDDVPTLLDFASSSGIDLTIVGPEAPLVAGIADSFAAAGLRCFGPSAAAARLEGSKTFTKEFLIRHNIPTAAYGSFTELDAAIEYFKCCSIPCVVKADGLAAGKGVIIANSLSEGIEAITDMLSGNVFGEAGSRVVIEEFLVGEEASFICMVDGNHILPMASSQDHKLAFDGDTGPNTGGMGAYSPAPIVDSSMHQTVMEKIMGPTVTGMAAEGSPYTGFLYAGLMIGEDDTPMVLEYNCRFGDPETQPIMLRLKSDLVELCIAAVDKKLDNHVAEWDSRTALGVVMAAQGYPGNYTSGSVISGLEDCEDAEVKVFHAGTKSQNGKIIASGGRVLCATALGQSISIAQRKAYELTESISWDGCWFRTDIGYQGIAWESELEK
jgi:phosphoribosylamine--glycine ligase